MAVIEIEEQKLNQGTAMVKGATAGGVAFVTGTLGTAEVINNMEKMGDNPDLWKAIAQTAGDFIGKAGGALSDVGTAIKDNVGNLKDAVTQAQGAAENISPEGVANAVKPENMDAAKQVFESIKDKAGETFKAVQGHADELGNKFTNFNKEVQFTIAAIAVVTTAVVTAVTLGHEHDKHSPQVDTAKTEVASKSVNAHAQGERLSFG